MQRVADSPSRSFPIISADSHFTEPADLWVRYTEPPFRDRAPHVEHRPENDVFVCDNTELLPIGMIHGVRYKHGDVELKGRYSDIPASGWDPEARITDIERDGITGEVLYPTIALRFFAIEDIPFANACARAYNTWAADFARQAPERFKVISMVSLDDVGAATQEMQRCKDLGMVGVMIPVFPDGAKPYHDEMYADFWAAAERLQLPVSLHAATERRLQGRLAPTERFLRYTQVQRTLIGMIYAGVFDRFPNLQVVSVENDAGWAANVIERMDYVDVKARLRHILQADHLNKLAPSHYWHNNISYTFMRDRAAILAREIVGVDRMMWASDFPHGDSTWPDSQQAIDEQMAGVPESEQRLLLHDNAARLYGF